MFIAWRDLRSAKGRFALMGAVVALLALLMVLLTGLSSGLVDNNISAIRSLPATNISFGADAGVNFGRSTVSRAQWEGMATLAGVQAAAPLGNTLFNAQAYADPGKATAARAEILDTGRSTTKGTAIDVALFGVQPDGFLAPPVITGEPLGRSADGVVVSTGLTDKGVAVGDTIVLDRVGTKARVVATTGDARYGHVPVVYAPLSLWQEATYGPPGGPPAGERLAPGVYDLATLIAVDAPDGADFTAADRSLGLTTVTRQASFNGSPGYKEETGTLTMIEGFLYVIAALLVGAFFMVWTIQRRPEIGLVKALGASNSYVVRDALGQAAVVLVVATVAGLAVGVLIGALVPNGVPFALDAGPVAVAAALVVAMGMIGALLSIRRITSVDPLIALGASR